MSSSAAISSQSAFAHIVNLSLELDELFDSLSGDTVADKMRGVFIRSFDQEGAAFSLANRNDWFLRSCDRFAVFARTSFGFAQVAPYSLEENLAYLQALFNKAAASQQLPVLPQGMIKERFSQRMQSKFSGNSENAARVLIDRIELVITNRRLALQRVGKLEAQIGEIRTLFSKVQATQTAAFIDKVLELRGELHSLQNTHADDFSQPLARIKADFMSAVPRPLVLQDDKNNYFDILFQIRVASLENAIHTILPIHSNEPESCPVSVAAVLKSGQGGFTRTLKLIRQVLAEIRQEVDELRCEITQYDRANTHLWNRLTAHETRLTQCLNTNAKSILCKEIDKLTKCVAMRITNSATLERFYPLYAEIRRCTCELVHLAQELPTQELRRELQEHMMKASKELQEVQMGHYLQLLRSEALPQVRKVLSEVMENKDPTLVRALERNIHNALSFLKGVYQEVTQVRDPHQLQVILELITTLEEAQRKLGDLRLQAPSREETTEQVVSDEGETAKSIFSSIVDGSVPRSILSTIRQYGPSVLFTGGVTYLTGGLSLGASLLAGLGATAGATIADGTAQQVLPKPIYEALGPFVDCGARLAVSYLTKGAVELTDFHPWTFRNSSSTGTSTEAQGASTAIVVAAGGTRDERAGDTASSRGAGLLATRPLALGSRNEAENAHSSSRAVTGEICDAIELQAPDCIRKAFAYLATGMSLEQQHSSAQTAMVIRASSP